MIVIKSTIGAGKRRHDVYDVCNSIADTGAERPDSIARFDTLELATVVMRYMRGDTLDETQTVEIVMPTENVNSSLTVTGSETPNVMVGGLDELAEASGESGKAVTVTMTVEEKSDAANASELQSFAKTTEHPNQSVECLEISIQKTVGSASTEITDTDNVLEIIVPYRFKGKENVEVYRYHGSAEKLEKLASKPTDSFTDGKYYPDTANGLLYIYASRFSTYAIGYTQCYNITGPIKYGSYTGTVTVSLLEGETVKYDTTASLSSGVGAYSFTHVLEGTYTLRAVWAEGGKEVTLSNAVTVG